MHYWRNNFPTLVEENKMFELLYGHFLHNKCLYNDLKERDLFLEFNNFIMKLVNNELDYFPKIDKTPFELMSDAGYILYECKSENIFANRKKIKNVFVLNDNNEITALKKSIFNPIYNKTLIKSLEKYIN